MWLEILKEPQRLTVLLQLTGRWQHNGRVQFALSSVEYINVAFFIRPATSQSSSYQIVISRFCEHHSRSNPLFKVWKWRESNRQPVS